MKSGRAGSAHPAGFHISAEPVSRIHFRKACAVLVCGDCVTEV